MIYIYIYTTYSKPPTRYVTVTWAIAGCFSTLGSATWPSTRPPAPWRRSARRGSAALHRPWWSHGAMNQGKTIGKLWKNMGKP